MRSSSLLQEPLQEWASIPQEVKEEPLDMVQGEILKGHAEIFRAAQQNVDGEVAVPAEYLGPQLGLDPHPVKREATFLPEPVESLRFPDQELDDGRGAQFKVKNPQLGGNELEETPTRRRRQAQEKVPVTAEVPHMGCNESGDLTEGLGVTYSEPSSVDVEGERASFSKGVRSGI
ncbi:hypothetical protein lerEdw1_006647 [Lerista edwardsae]|nr:hypothetical protein lerEdw1_006647 [Lerista edwardsae]